MNKSLSHLFYLLFGGLLLSSFSSCDKSDATDDSDQTPSDLIAYWAFDGNGTDTSIYKHHVSLNNLTPTANRFGQPGKALYFNGTDSYASISDSKVLRLSNTDFTLNAWIKLDAYDSSFGSNILSKHITGANNGWGWSVCGYASPATGPGFYGPGGGSVNAVGKKVVSLNDWHMVSAVYRLSTQELSIYLDGILDNVVSGIASPNAAISASLFIGKDEPTNKYHFKGALDDISIYSKAISSTGIKELHDASKPQSNELIAYWPFDGDGKDHSNNGNTASLHNLSPTADRFCRAGGALYFDGISSYASVADNMKLRLNNTDFTLNGWVKMDAYNVSYGSNILSKHITGLNNGWGWSVCGYASPATGPLFYGPGGGSNNAVGTTVVTLNQWHMVTGVYNKSAQTLSLYIDGELNNTSNGILSPNGNISAMLYIGKDQPTNMYYYKGAMDDLRIYGRALSSQEIKQFYSSTSGGCAPGEE
ncbi:LamG domain-containing protein [Paradesertivirga mongoliensis]|uniref:LamG domain-containing protein n=1 Tax=Paradesertivirga mongoliensis TaxID=2100740 RepID=A0ABW4ZJ09_9SPHI|nr:LamG domain-containing protein [Pedobacter mongoliensis]